MDPNSSPPPAVQERVAFLDILRGLALLGMVLVHFHGMETPEGELPELSPVEQAIGWIVWVGVEQKSWGTFALLFGAGFGLLLHRTRGRAESIVIPFLRRMGALAVFGVLLYLTTGFTILWEYALCGVVLLLLRDWSPRALLLTALAVFAARPLAGLVRGIHEWATIGAAASNAIAVEAGRDIGAHWLAFNQANRGPDFLAAVDGRWDHLLWQLARPTSVLLGAHLPLFLIGFAAMKVGVFTEPLRHRRVIVWAMALGALSWAMAWYLYSRDWQLPFPPEWPRRVTNALTGGMGLIHDQLLCLTYVGGALLVLAHRPVWQARLAPLGAAGRMALTNYVLQVMVVHVLSAKYLLGWTIRPYMTIVATALLMAALIGVSRWWLVDHPAGPLESGWRAITWWRAPQWRRGAASAWHRGLTPLEPTRGGSE